MCYSGRAIVCCFVDISSSPQQSYLLPFLKGRRTEQKQRGCFLKGGADRKWVVHDLSLVYGKASSDTNRRGLQQDG